MYVGDNKFIADTGTYDSSGSSSSSKMLTASEINKDDYTGVVRYPGVNAEPKNTSSGNNNGGSDTPSTEPQTPSTSAPATEPTTSAPPTKLSDLMKSMGRGGTRI